MRRATVFAGMFAALLLSASSAAADPEWSRSFVEAFRAACVPERLSYDGTLKQARAEGWTEFAPSGHAEFGMVMSRSDEALKAEAEEMEMTFRSATFARAVEGRSLHLVVSFLESEYLDAVGCYIYDFGATEAVVSAAVSNMLGIKPAQSHRDDTMIAYVWGPPPSMPRTLDTHMTFVPPGSPLVEQVGFDGVVLKFSTSAPDGDSQ